MTVRRNPAKANATNPGSKPPRAPVRRSYGQYCGLAHALDVVGERWTLLILRDLLLGPRRYGELLAGLQGVAGGPRITTNLLAKRLRELEGTGLIERCEAQSSHAYRLTRVGALVEPAIQELARWGGTHFMQGQTQDERLSLGWMLLNLKRKATPTAQSVLVEVSDLDGDRYTLRLDARGLDVSAGVPVACAARLRGDPMTLHRVLFRGESVAKLSRAGLLEVSGDQKSVRQLAAALSLPSRTEAGHDGRGVAPGRR